MGDLFPAFHMHHLWKRKSEGLNPTFWLLQQSSGAIMNTFEKKNGF